MSENIVEIVGKQLVESADVEDRKFLLEFVKSQMFNQYIVDNCEIE